LSDEFGEQPIKNGLMDHFYRTTDPDELERLMLVIARKPTRAENILHSAGFLERMMVHIIHCMLTIAYGLEEARKFEPTESVRAIAAKVRVNHLMHRTLETGVDDLIAGVQDQVIRQNFVEVIAAHAITIVDIAQKTHAQQPVGSDADAKPPKPTELET
jgi:hypothetical protein